MKYNIYEKWGTGIMIFIILFIGIMVMGLASAATIGTYSPNQCVNIIQTCSNCTYVNISSIDAIGADGQSINLLGQVVMENNAPKYNYTFCDTGYIGEYSAVTSGNPDGINDVETITFTIGQGSIIIFVIIFGLIYAIAFIGFFGKNVWVSIIGGLGMIIIGIFTITNGIDAYRGFITNAFSVITVGLGMLFSITAGIHIIKESYN